MRARSVIAYAVVGSLILILNACGHETTGEEEGISGTYILAQNDCEDDGQDITIVQEGSDLTFQNGFDSAPSPYFGTIDSDGNITFSNGEGNCEATIDVDGIFVGICHYPSEDCEFFYTPPITLQDVP